MKHHTTKYIGMDVHKNTIVIAIAEDDRTGEIRPYGAIPNDLGSLDRFIRKQVSQGSQLRFVYEAGPTGYGIYRHLNGNGFDCLVVAPSLIPRKKAIRIKNDRRDACELARLHRSGDLQGIHVPTPEDEAMRDLLRGREDAKRAERKAKQRLQSFLLRHDLSYPGKSCWTTAHFAWLSDIKTAHRSQQITLQEYIDSIHESARRVARLNDTIVALVKEWRFEPVVTAIQALRGVSLLTGVTIVAEIGSFSRFAKPSELMAYLGLVPSLHASGETVKYGGITKAGNAHARRALIEAAWSYRFPARMTRHLLRRSRNVPPGAREIGWKAQVRLCGRFRHLSQQGKPVQVVTTAIARELVGFIWAIGREIEPQAV